VKKVLIFLWILWLAAAPGAAISEGERGDMAYYVVQPGDCLDNIAAAYRMPKAIVMQMNLLWDEMIVPGQILRFYTYGRDDTAFGGLFLSPNQTVPFFTAQHFHVTVNGLKNINYFPDDQTVSKGQILKIPIRNSIFPWKDLSVLLEDAYIVQEGDTLSAIAAAFSVDEQILIAMNRLNERELHPGYIMHLGRMKSDVPGGYKNGYVVQKGDTLSRIAGKYSLDIDEIVSINDIADIDQLVRGQILLLP